VSGTTTQRSPFKVYPEARLALVQGGLIGPARIALLQASYTPGDTHRIWSDASAHEVVGAGYTAGGIALATLTTLHATTVTRVRMQPANVSWPGSTFSAKYAVLLKPVGVEPIASALLIGISDLNPAAPGAEVTIRAGILTLAWAGRTLINLRSGSL